MTSQTRAGEPENTNLRKEIMESQLFTSQMTAVIACLSSAGQSQYITHTINAAKLKRSFENTKARK